MNVSAVVIPVVSSTKSKAYFELLYQAKTTLANRKHYFKRTKQNITMSPHVYNLSNDKYNIYDYIRKCTDDNKKIECLYIVAHHEILFEIGLTGESGISPKILAKNLVDKVSIDGLNNIKRIDFFTCNSAHNYLNGENSSNNSYCGKFSNEMWNKYCMQHIIIGGFNGFLYEDIKKKHTYIAPYYDNYVKKFRCEECIILFIYNNKVS